MSTYAEKFWKKNWDEGLEDLEPNEYETTFVEMIKEAFEKVPGKTALIYLGVDITFQQVDLHANQFANMLRENGFEKGM